MIRRALAFILRPVFRLYVRRFPVGDPWERLDSVPRLALYGAGARHDFAHYLAGASAVDVASVEEIQAWLLGCRYESDEALFNEPDFWQHPATFERLRAGDCEDFAVWAWRKLLGLGIDADLVTGHLLKEGRLAGRHAWVVYRVGGAEFLVEPVARSRQHMIVPLALARAGYLPQFGVDRAARRFAYAGYLLAEKLKLEAVDLPARRSA